MEALRMVVRILQGAGPWLPRDRRDSGRQGELAPPLLDSAPPERPERVLIAGPDPLTLARLRKTLERHGFQHVTVARDGGEALEMAIGFQPEVVIADLAMPVLDGIALAARVRAVPRLRDVCIMLLQQQSTRAGQTWPAGAAGNVDCVMPESAPQDLICERLSQFLSSGERRSRGSSELARL